MEGISITTTKRMFTKYVDETEVEEAKKVLNIAVLGSPNAGKSTLINHIVGQRVFAVSPVAHTTRQFSNGILNIANTQLIFTDTPGVISHREGHRLKMEKSHIRAPRRVAGSADILAVVTDSAFRKTKNYIDENILKIIDEHHEIPAILIMNKIDMLRRKEDLLFLTKILTQDRIIDEWGYKLYGGSSKFRECFFTSALTGDGVSELIDYFVIQAKQRQWEYPDNMVCDSSIEKQISEVFREKLLVLFSQEIPWQVKQDTLLFDYSDNGLRLHQKLTWPKKSQRRYVLTKLEMFNEECLKVLENLFDCPIKLTIEISQKDRMTKDDLIQY